MAFQGSLWLVPLSGGGDVLERDRSGRTTLFTLNPCLHVNFSSINHLEKNQPKGVWGGERVGGGQGQSRRPLNGVDWVCPRERLSGWTQTDVVLE